MQETDQTNPFQKPVHRRLPPATITVLAVTIVITGLQFLYPEVLEVLRRRPGTLAAGEWWRIISPLFVHAEGWPHLLSSLKSLLETGKSLVETRTWPKGT